MKLSLFQANDTIAMIVKPEHYFQYTNVILFIKIVTFFVDIYTVKR